MLGRLKMTVMGHLIFHWQMFSLNFLRNNFLFTPYQLVKKKKRILGGHTYRHGSLCPGKQHESHRRTSVIYCLFAGNYGQYKSSFWWLSATSVEFVLISPYLLIITVYVLPLLTGLYMFVHPVTCISLQIIQLKKLRNVDKKIEKKTYGQIILNNSSLDKSRGGMIVNI